MDVKHRTEDGVSVVSLAGRLDSATAGDVMDRLNAFVTAGPPQIVINLREVAYISSAGLRSILVAAKLAHSNRGELRLCEATPGVAKVFVTSGFTNLIHMDEQEAQSVAALRKA